MIVYLADRHLNVLASASTSLPDGYIITDDSKVSEVTNGVSTFSFHIHYPKGKRLECEKAVAVGNYIFRESRNKKFEFYTIIDAEHDTDDDYINVYSEDAGMDLLNEVFGEYGSEEPQTAAWYIEKFAYDSGFEIGVNEIPDDKLALEWTDTVTTMNRIQSVADYFGAEIGFSFDIDRMKINKKYIDIYKKRGKDKDIYLRLGQEIRNINVKRSIANVCTCLRPVGSEPENDYSTASESTDAAVVSETSGHKAYKLEVAIDIKEENPKHNYNNFGYRNETLVKCTMKARRTVNQAAASFTGNFYITIDGTELQAANSFSMPTVTDDNRNTWYEIGSCEKTVAHASNGAKSIKVSGRVVNSGMNCTIPAVDVDLLTIVQPTNLIGFTYDDGDCYIDKNGWLKSRDGLEKWTRYKIESGKDEGHIVQDFEYDTLDRAMLCYQAVLYLKEHENAEINLEVDLYDKLPEGTELGDIVYVIDDEGEVYASARLLKIEERDSTNEDIITLGDYIIKDSGISEQVAQLAADFKRLAETRERYTWIAYADDIYGTNISEYPDEHPYMGIAENMVGSTIDISDPTRFKWSRIAGKDPRDGTTRLWTGLSQPTEAPIGGQWYFSYSQLYDGDKYDAIVGDTIFFEGYYYLVHHIDGEDVWCYSRTDVNGADGKDGESPTIDLVRDGDNKNTKIVIHNPDGTTKESIVYDGADGEDPVIEAERVGNKTHIYVDGQEIAVVDDGADGKTPTITTNKVGDTTTVYVDGKSVATIKDGSNGVGINSVTITYGKSASASTMPTSWSSDIPSDLSDGEFLWTRTVIDYTDSEKPDTVSYTYAQQGKNGETGKAGTSVKVSKIEYQAGTSATTAPTGTWSTSVVSVSPGQYLWTKTTFSDNNVAYGVAYQGKNGADSTSYSILTSVAAVVYTKSKTLNPTSIVFSGKAQTGTNAMVNYSGRFKIETSTDGSTWTTTYSGTKNEASYTYTVPTGVSFIRGSLYLAGGLTTLLDQETVPVISEGTDGTNGKNGTNGTNGKNGTNGTNGADGYTVLLTNDSHTFAAGTTAVVTAQSTVCGVIAYKGITQVAATIGTITGAPTGMTTTIANNGKTNAQVTVSVGTTMTTANGELKIPVTVDGKTFNLTFSYALAFTGAKGDKGNKGDKGDKGDSGITNGYTILWNYSAFSTANPAEAYICAYDQTTGKASDANGWVMFEGTKRTVTKGMVNPNSMAPFNIPIYIVERLSSATATTGTNYLVWYNSGWKYLTKGIDASATDQAVDKWTWAVTTDIILGMFVGPASEKAFVGMEIFDPPYSAKQITTNTITAAGASAAAETANTKVTTLETRVTNIEPELIIGTHGTTATATWTGKSKKIQHPSDIVAGTTIKFKLTSAGASNVTLNITCVDNTATGAKNVYFKGTTRLSTQYTSGSIINLMYDGTSWYVVSPYTNSTYNQGNVAYNNNVKAAAAIAKETIIVGTKAGYKQAAKDVTFDITYPILYAAEAIASGATSTNCWTQRASVSLTANKSDVSLVAYQKAYLVGTLAADNVTFKIDEIVFGTEPTEANGKIYLSIGLLYSTTQIHFDGGIQRPYAYAQIKNGTNVISSGFMPLELAKNTEISLSHKTYTVSTDSSIQTLTEWKGKITSQMETDSEEYAAYKEQIAKDLAEATKRIVGLEQTLDSIGFIIRVKPDDTEAQANTKKQTNKSQTDYLKEAGVLAKSFLKEDGFHVQTSGSQTQSILSGQELKMVNAAGQIMISVGASSTSLRNANLNGTAGQILTHDIKRGHRKELSVLIAEGSATVETLNFYWKGGNS